MRLRGFAAGLLAEELPALESAPNLQLCGCFPRKVAQHASANTGEGKTRLRCWKVGFQLPRWLDQRAHEKTRAGSTFKGSNCSCTLPKVFLSTGRTVRENW